MYMEKKNLQLINFVLVIAMVAQIVGFSFIMDDISRGHHDQQITYHHHQSILDFDDIESEQVNHDESFVDDCCASPACGVAAITNSNQKAIECRHNFIIVYSVAWHTVSLPADFKPPKIIS